MDKSFLIQKQARDNVQNLQSYLTDLQNWEKEMKRKEAALNEEFEQDLPPVRSKIKKEKPVATKKPTEKKISASDYSSWEKFDVDKACEEIDMADAGPSSLDSKKSQQEKLNMLRDEALHEKERGNNFVKHSKWDEAIGCYNRAIELVKDDATYYANRGLCHLKKNSPLLAESDCTEALKLDPTYVKALHRRALAREKLGSLKDAVKDLEKIQKLEPNNEVSMKLLKQLKSKMGSKGPKSKSSSKIESKEFSRNPKIADKPKELTALEKWKKGIGENITIVDPIVKPPHLRSKKPLIQVPIVELPLPFGSSKQTKKISQPVKIETISTTNNNIEILDKNNENISVNKINGFASPESNKLITDSIQKEKYASINLDNLVPPSSNFQFTTDWKSLKGHQDAQSYYLSLIDPNKIPSIFENALESDILAELIASLYENRDKFKEKPPALYLKGISNVKRFGALSMFLSGEDKKRVNELLSDAKQNGCPNEDIDYLRKKYEV